MNRQFGALSGIAIFLIVLNHSIEIGLNIPQDLGFKQLDGWGRDFLSILQAFGVFAVPIFLFISGSFIAYATKGDPPTLSIKFLITSLKHILIPYLIWSGLFYITVYFIYDQSYGLTGYIKNLLVGYPFHFIPLLVFYYLISPLLIRIGKKYAALLLIIITVYQLFLITVLQPGILGFKLPEWSYTLTPPVLRTTMADWGIFFPLGLVYGLHTNMIKSWIFKLRWLMLALFVIFFMVGVLSFIFKLINFPISRYISMAAFIFLVPVIRRDSIPYVRQLEKLGRRSYGIYLSHLITLELIFLALKTVAPRILTIPLISFPILLVMGLLIPLGIMEFLANAPTKRYYRYIFG